MGALQGHNKHFNCHTKRSSKRWVGGEFKACIVYRFPVHTFWSHSRYHRNQSITLFYLGLLRKALSPSLSVTDPKIGHVELSTSATARAG